MEPRGAKSLCSCGNEEIDVSETLLNIITENIYKTKNIESICKCLGSVCSIHCQFLQEPTPRGECLRGRYKYSSAYIRINIVFHMILDVVYNYVLFVATKMEKNDVQTKKFIEYAVESLKKLKEEIRSNNRLDLIEGIKGDVSVWNRFLSGHLALPWFMSKLLHAECYLYRRLYSVFDVNDEYRTLDYFQLEKRKSLRKASYALGFLSRHLLFIMDYKTDDEHQPQFTGRMFTRLIKLSLWATKYQRICLQDESFKIRQSPIVMSKVWDRNILANHTEIVWEYITKQAPMRQIDYLLGSGVLELFCDLCLAHFLICRKLTRKVIFHVKSIPWAVFDTTKHDLDDLIKYMQSESEPNVYKLGHQWEELFESKVWSVEENDYWTLPYEYDLMEDMSPELYSQLSLSSLLVFKGELHHRKLIADKNWQPDTNFSDTLGRFHPAPILSLRVIEHEVVCGLATSVKEEMDKTCNEWMLSGSCAVILFDRTVPQQHSWECVCPTVITGRCPVHSMCVRTKLLTGLPYK